MATPRPCIDSSESRRPDIAERDAGRALVLRHERNNGSFASSELALVAIAPDRVVGVDLERKQWKASLKNIATRFFSPGECGILENAATTTEKADCFYSLWSMKEAILKATGEGIADLTKVEVLPELKSSGDEVDAARWRLHDLSPIDGFGAALAVEGEGARLSLWRWEG